MDGRIRFMRDGKKTKSIKLYKGEEILENHDCYQPERPLHIEVKECLTLKDRERSTWIREHEVHAGQRIKSVNMTRRKMDSVTIRGHKSVNVDQSTSENQYESECKKKSTGFTEQEKVNVDQSTNKTQQGSQDKKSTWIREQEVNRDHRTKSHQQGFKHKKSTRVIEQEVSMDQRTSRIQQGSQYRGSPHGLVNKKSTWITEQEDGSMDLNTRSTEIPEQEGVNMDKRARSQQGMQNKNKLTSIRTHEVEQRSQKKKRSTWINAQVEFNQYHRIRRGEPGSQNKKSSGLTEQEEVSRDVRTRKCQHSLGYMKKQKGSKHKKTTCHRTKSQQRSHNKRRSKHKKRSIWTNRTSDL